MALQVYVTQKSLTPQSLAATQPTQPPFKHIPFIPQAVPLARLVNVGVPATHVSFVQELESLGRSELSAVDVTPPVPLHTRD